MSLIKISVVVSVFNEEEVLFSFWKELSRIIKQRGNDTSRYEIIFVNDGSNDKSAEILDNISDSSTAGTTVKVIHFSRNFGHEAAMLAGIEHANGEAIICMDADLQHPPTCIPKMIEEYFNGYDILLMIRDQRDDGGWIKKITSSLFYHIINILSKEKFEPMASDFFLISQRVAQQIIKHYGERTRFLRGIIQSIGFKRKSLPYVAPMRKAGKSKYSLFKLLFFSLSAIATFSNIPLRLGLALGIMFGGFSFITGIYSIIMWFVGQPYSGYTTLVLLLSLGMAMLFLVIGIIGEYIGYIFAEVKNRPLYIIDRVSSQIKEIPEDL